MGLNGMLVMDKAGSPVYSKFLDPSLKMEPAMIAGLMSAIQMFASGISSGSINEFTMQDKRVLYRQMDGITFIGFVDGASKVKHVDLILEYLIWVFLATFKKRLAAPEALHNLAEFEGFDQIFLQYREAKEKELHRCAETVSTGLLQCMLNKMVDLFPVSDLVQASGSLKLIGKKLVWVDINIVEDEETRLMSMLKEKTDLIYGAGMFDGIKQEIVKKVTRRA